MEQKNKKNFLALMIIAFELGTINSNDLEQDTCHCQSIRYETPLRFTILVTQIFSKSRSTRVMEKYDESSLM